MGTSNWLEVALRARSFLVGSGGGYFQSELEVAIGLGADPGGSGVACAARCAGVMLSEAKPLCFEFKHAQTFVGRGGSDCLFRLQCNHSFRS